MAEEESGLTQFLTSTPHSFRWSARRHRNDSALFNACHAARCVACHGVLSHPVPVALVGECSIPVV